ncbi:hypothetical protein HYR99_12605 [Candidatus Poribacteria bacterium]|nr:hypothetical protein [Candidatus Poribacteria bacterium]
MKNQRTNEITAEDEKLAQDWEKFAEAEGKTYQALAKLAREHEPIRLERKRVVLHLAPYILEALEDRAKKGHITMDELAEDLLVQGLF